MTGADARRIRREVLKMSVSRLATALHMHGTHAGDRIHRWETGRDNVPGWVEVIFGFVENCAECRQRFWESASG